MSIGKLFSGAVLTVLLVAAVGGSVAAFSAGKGIIGVTSIIGTAVLSTVVIFLLNIAGLWFGKKSYGMMGTLIAVAVLAYGIYVLKTNNTGLGLDMISSEIVGGVSAGVGSVGLLTSIGVITANL